MIITQQWLLRPGAAAETIRNSALVAGERRGEAEPFDLDAFVEAKRKG